MDLYGTKHAVFEGSAAQTWDNTALLVELISNFQQKRSLSCTGGFAYGWTWAVDHPKSSSIAKQHVLWTLRAQTLEKAWFGRALEGRLQQGRWALAGK